eukprot:TRINITY_DN7108_c0_g1_i1.p2 TRINITY_DN7108_c0_g1~~TRINITY_DN7108_c0_g1_i1.p2  ORF type:complete len:162 (-),score=38.39 TRINITY_DN7108_c0_g1_i1:554-1039(-)
MKEQNYIYIAMLGRGGVGKTAMTIKFLDPRVDFVEYDPTIEDAYRKSVNVDGKSCVVEILDFAACDYEETLKMFINRGHGFMCIYSIIDRQSFNQIISFRDKILHLKAQAKVPMIVVANKSDLEEQREVSQKEGHDLATIIGCPFIETSAKAKFGPDFQTR